MSLAAPGRTRKALVIATEFPPAFGAGVQRTFKFVRYLPEFGWNAVVLTRDPERDGDRVLDLETLAEAGRARIERVPYHNPFATLESLARRLGSGGMTLRPFSVALKYLWAPLPEDHYFWWTRRVFKKALRLINEERPDLIYTSGPPHSVHLLGLRIKCRTGLPLVADFRDAWSRRPIWDQKGYSRKVDRIFERRVLRGADRIVCNTRIMLEDFATLDPACRARCSVITNGFDPEDFSGAGRHPAEETRPTRLFHVGYTTPGSSGALLRALAVFRERSAEATNHLECTFLGGLDREGQDLVHSHDLARMVLVKARVTHREAVHAMCRADVLLLLLSEDKRWAPVYPGKLFEYMASGRPVLASVPEGLASELVRRTGIGLAVASKNQPELVEALGLAAESPQAFARRYHVPNREEIARYERRRLTEELAGIFDAVAADGY